MRLISVSLFLVMIAMATAADPLRHSRQCVVVVAPAWNSKTAVLRAFERTRPDSDWKMRGTAMPVVLGKNGLGWGRGVIDAKNTDGPRKIEGDNRAPAGIFHLGPAFGYAPAQRARWLKLRYLPLTKEMEGIDDPRSRYYNQLVDRSNVVQVDWRTSERMLRADDLYKWGIVVAHNPTATPGAGSCIFLHIWKKPSTATTGCTAMAERDLVKLLHWLDPNAHPILAQMPRRAYTILQSSYELPAIPEKPPR